MDDVDDGVELPVIRPSTVSLPTKVAGSCWSFALPTATM